jgi:hypothetical protein
VADAVVAGDEARRPQPGVDAAGERHHQVVEPVGEAGRGLGQHPLRQRPRRGAAVGEVLDQLVDDALGLGLRRPLPGGERVADGIGHDGSPGVDTPGVHCRQSAKELRLDRATGRRVS